MKENCLERMERIGGERKIADFIVKQKQGYQFKIEYARLRAEEFVRECGERELNCHVSVGGLDSITLFLFLKSIGINVPGITVSYLEDMSIQRMHKALGMIRLKSALKPDKKQDGRNQKYCRSLDFLYFQKKLRQKLKRWQIQQRKIKRYGTQSLQEKRESTAGSRKTAE